MSPKGPFLVILIICNDDKKSPKIPSFAFFRHRETFFRKVLIYAGKVRGKNKESVRWVFQYYETTTFLNFLKQPLFTLSIFSRNKAFCEHRGSFDFSVLCDIFCKKLKPNTVVKVLTQFLVL